MSAADCDAGVEYRPVDGFPGYRVGSDGTVWTCRPRCGRGALANFWRELKQKTTPRGYREVVLCREGTVKCFRVNRLVAIVSKPEVNHKNGIKSDNFVGNLEWATRSENESHAFRIGLKVAPKGQDRHNAKLTESQAKEILARISRGDKQSHIAREFGVHQTTITDLKLGRSWRHLSAGGVP